MTKPKQPPEPTDAQKLKRANDAVRMTQLIKNGDREMQDSPMFRARIRHAARAADYVDWAQETGLLGEGD
jgi:hypothetical protein